MALKTIQSTQTIEETFTEVLEKELDQKVAELIVFNDDVNTFDHVIECFERICDHAPEQAEQCAYIIHYKGKCTVKTGSYDELKPPCEALLEEGLSAMIDVQ